jgi:hypothetical protein
LAAETEHEAVGFRVVKEREGDERGGVQATETPRVEIDGTWIEVKDQIQMIAPNEVLDHPLLSPVTQASLGGLCPLLIVCFLVGKGLSNVRLRVEANCCEMRSFMSHIKLLDHQNTRHQKSISINTPNKMRTSINTQEQKYFSKSSTTALMYISPLPRLINNR